MNIYKSSGIAMGIALGLVICFIIFKYANNNHKVRTEYDERQRVIRNKGYKIAFYTALILNAFPVVMTAIHGGLLENGKLSPVFINLLALVMLAAMGIVMVIRDRMDRNEEKE